MQIPLSVVSTVWMPSPISEEELSELPECVIGERPVRRAERVVKLLTQCEEEEANF